MNANRGTVSAPRRLLHNLAAAVGLMTLCGASLLFAAAPDKNAPAKNAVAAAPAADIPVPPDPPALPFAPNSSSDTAAPSDNTLTITPDEPSRCARPRPGDQIWLISTRQLGCGICLDGDPGLQFWRMQDNRWQSADLKTFLAADDPHTPTDFYIHGNANTAEDANDHGFTVYDRLVEQAPKDRHMRFVIWSWPTDPGRHPIQLVRAHAYRSDTDAWYLGWLLSRMDRRVPIGLDGYSFGARVATGAIHLMGGGELLGSALKLDPKAGRPMIRAVLLAAAEDAGWLSPGAPNGMAIPTVDRMLLVNNGCDSSLKLYPHMDRCTRASALGYVGLATDDPKIAQCDACCTVGSEHNWEHYFCNECLVAQMRPYLYLADFPAIEKSGDVAKAAAKAIRGPDKTSTTLVIKP